MKKILYTIVGILVGITMGGYLLAQASCVQLASVFPVSIDPFTIGNCIPSAGWVALEKKIGINQSVSTSSLDYQINHIMTSYGSEVVSSTAVSGFFSNFYSDDQTPTNTQISVSPTNTTILFAYPIKAAVQASKITVFVQTKDSSSTDLYDIGLYNASGTLVANVGATSTWTTATGTQTMSFKQGTVNFTSGKYYLGLTGVSTTLQLYEGLSRWLFVGSTNGLSTASSTVGLNATTSVPSDSYTTGLIPSIVLHQ